MKKILTIGLVLLLIFIIYLCNVDRKVYYVALGNSFEYESDMSYGYSHYVKKYLKDKNVLEKFSDVFSRNDSRITDIINDIKINRKISSGGESFMIKNALVKADLVTISISYNDVVDRMEDDSVYDYIDGLALDLDSLFSLMREYCKEDIVMVGFFNQNKIFRYLNKKFKEVCLAYDVSYVDISNISSLENEKIGKKVTKVVSKKVFEG